MEAKVHSINLEDRFVCECSQEQLKFFESKEFEAAPYTGYFASYYGPKDKGAERWQSAVKEHDELEKIDAEAAKELKKKICAAFPCFKAQTILVGDDDLLQIVRLKLAYMYISTATVDAQAPSVDFTEKLGRLTEKFLEGLSRANEAAFNIRCSAPKVDEALIRINDVMLLEDACTDKLQDHLNKGWRILAVCPQPDQRRPDYVLGRAGTDR